MEFSKNLLRIDAEKTAADLAAVIKRQIHQDLKRSGAVVGISGGIDSSVVAALCAKALGPDKVLGVMLPEKESASESKTLGEKLATQLGIHHMVNNIAAPLEGYGCYKMRNEAIRRVFPEFQDSWPMKITIGSKLLEREGFNYFNLVVETPDGRSLSKRMPQAEYLQEF